MIHSFHEAFHEAFHKAFHEAFYELCCRTPGGACENSRNKTRQLINEVIKIKSSKSIVYSLPTRLKNKRTRENSKAIVRIQRNWICPNYYQSDVVKLFVSGKRQNHVFSM